MSWHKEQQGYVTFAQNTDTVDYLHLAYIQALNIKATQQQNRYAVLVDARTKELITDEHRQVFDYIIDIKEDHNTPESDKKFANEWQVFWLTPFKETIKLESDLLFTRSIDHWWTAFRLRNVCLSTGTKNYQGFNSSIRKYRELFDANSLPDVYNGLMYFRFSQEARDFFEVAGTVSRHWSYVKTHLKKCLEDQPSTDVLYGVTALMMGVENCTMPNMDFINFVHMKPAINGFDESQSFQDVYLTEFDTDTGMIRINNVNQYHPLHYYDKTFPTQEMIDYYGSRISQSTRASS
jgi:hypothetical protein